MNVFGTLPPIIIEDILCIYSDYFYGHIKRKHCSLACNYIKDDTYGKPWWRNKTKDFVAQQDYLIEQSKKKGIVVWPVFKPLLK